MIDLQQYASLVLQESKILLDIMIQDAYDNHIAPSIFCKDVVIQIKKSFDRVIEEKEGNHCEEE